MFHLALKGDLVNCGRALTSTRQHPVVVLNSRDSRELDPVVAPANHRPCRTRPRLRPRRALPHSVHRLRHRLDSQYELAREIFKDVTANNNAGTSEEQDVAVTLEWHGQAAVLSASGEIDMVTAPQFQKDLFAALAESPTALVVDLTKVGFFASAGLSALVAAYQQAPGDTVLRVVAPNTVTARPLQVTALDRKIPVYASCEDALAED
jgi:anti-anti-sigma factor